MDGNWAASVSKNFPQPDCYNSQVMNDDLSRRSFNEDLRWRGGLAAPGILRSQNPNGTVQIGWIGVGSRGYYLMDRLYTGSAANVQVAAVCDTTPATSRAAKDRVQTMGHNTPKTYNDYLQLLQDPSIDAVVISTPEHLHYPMFMAALKAKQEHLR